jgi:glutamate 5-kinase
VNEGAREVLLAGRASLLAAGVVGLEGDFERDDVVAIADLQGRDFARGVATLGRAEAERALTRGPAGARATSPVLVNRTSFVLLEQA